MSIRDLIPRIRKSNVPVRRAADSGLPSLQREVNRLFDDFFDGFGLAPRWTGMESALATFDPRVDLSETNKEVRITAELPGMDEKNVNVEIDEDCLTIHGTKEEQHEEKEGRRHLVERSYGSFHRVIGLPAGVRTDNASARFRNGVLTVILPRDEKAGKTGRKIEIES